jgi:peptide deformylase
VNTLTIYKDDHPILKKIAEPVPEITSELRTLAAEMMATMHLKGGVGLAAPQVGHSIRLIVFDLVNQTSNVNNSGWMFNPEIVDTSDSSSVDKEGCLSYPNRWVDIERKDTVTVRYVSLSGQVRTQIYTGLTARVILHEIDHLNGKVITDYEKSTL